MKYEETSRNEKKTRKLIKNAEKSLDDFVLEHISYGSAEWCQYQRLLFEYRCSIYPYKI